MCREYYQVLPSTSEPVVTGLTARGLEGLEGSMTIDVAEGRHTYGFEYTLAADDSATPEPPPELPGARIRHHGHAEPRRAAFHGARVLENEGAAAALERAADPAETQPIVFR